MLIPLNLLCPNMVSTIIHVYTLYNIPQNNNKVQNYWNEIGMKFFLIFCLYSNLKRVKFDKL